MDGLENLEIRFQTDPVVGIHLNDQMDSFEEMTEKHVEQLINALGVPRMEDREFRLILLQLLSVAELNSKHPGLLAGISGILEAMEGKARQQPETKGELKVTSPPKKNSPQIKNIRKLLKRSISIHMEVCKTNDLLLDLLIRIGEPTIPHIAKALGKCNLPRMIDLINVLKKIRSPEAVACLVGNMDNLITIELGKDALRTVLAGCRTHPMLLEFETGLQEGYDRLKKKHKKEDFTNVQMQIARLKMAIARKKNQLAEDKGVLLDDKPKPPKRGMYQQLRRLRNG